jgi:hypothetical protein
MPKQGRMIYRCLKKKEVVARLKALNVCLIKRCPHICLNYMVKK